MIAPTPAPVRVPIADAQRGADSEPLNVGAARKERHVEQRGQKHSEERADPEEAPLIG